MPFLLLLVVAFVVASLAIAAILFFIAFLAMLSLACVIGLPIWMIVRHWLRQRGLSRPTQPPLERLKTLYVEGKIDIFEFERRAAALMAVEH